MEMLLHFTTNGCLILLIKYFILKKKCIVNLLSPNIHVVVNFLSQVIVVFLLFWGMATYAAWAGFEMSILGQ